MCIHPCTHLHQSSVVGATEIDGTYKEILQRFEELLVELKFRQEQQRIEEEEVEKLRKIREEQVREVVIDSSTPFGVLMINVLQHFMLNHSIGSSHPRDRKWTNVMLHSWRNTCST